MMKIRNQVGAGEFLLRETTAFVKKFAEARRLLRDYWKDPRSPESILARISDLLGVQRNQLRGEISGERDRTMNAYTGWDYIGAEGQSYPEIASRAVRGVQPQNPSPIYGYLRTGAQQKIYLFPALDDARGWFTTRVHDQAQPYDYAAVFVATDLTRPVPGLESFGRTLVSGDPYVGNWWPLLLGLPLGGLGGYYLRQWQEEKHPGQSLAQVATHELERMKQLAPKTSGEWIGGPWYDFDPAYGPWVGQDPYVGGPWVDLVGRGQDVQAAGEIGYGASIGGPWVDLVRQDYDGYGPWVGAETDDAARRSAWPLTRELIQSSIAEVSEYAASYPAEAYVWTLDAPSAPRAGRAPGSVVMLEGTTTVVPFSSRAQALDYLREVSRTRPVALAMFERSSRHWPNPVAWRKSDEPQAAQVIAQHVASRSATRASGTYAGAWDTVVGRTALDDVRRRAQTLADKRAGNVVGVIHTAKDGLWHTLAFRTSDDADDWLGTATHDPSSYTYAAYFDKEDFQWPHPVNEKIGGTRTPARREPIRREIATTSGDVGFDVIGAALDDFRSRAKQLATARPGNAAGVIRTADGLWHALGFSSLDDSVDWLQTATRDKASFTYAAIFEKAADGTAYFQDEEVGVARAPSQPGPPIPRGVATTSGDWWGE
jgi:hypothetical protein